MPVTIAYDTKFTLEINGFFINSPSTFDPKTFDSWKNNFGDSEPSYVFDDINWDSGSTVVIQNTTRTTVNKDGREYTQAFTIDPLSNYLLELSYGIDGQTVLAQSYINFPLNQFLILSGDILLEQIYSGNDAIYGASGPDIIFGYDGNDFLSGGGGNDIFDGGWGYNAIYGGDGIDTAIYGYDAQNYAISKVPNSDVVYIGFVVGGYDLLNSIEKIKVANGLISTEDAEFVGYYNDFTSASVNPVIRFYNTRDNAFFYTADLNEADTVIDNSVPFIYGTGETRKDQPWPYVNQGTTFEAANSSDSTAVPAHRFYNRETGHHLWSIDPNEISLIKNKWASGEWSFGYEGTSFYVHTSDPEPNNDLVGREVYRLYNPETGRHVYSADVEEIDLFVLTGVWQLEGVAFWST